MTDVFWTSFWDFCKVAAPVAGTVASAITLHSVNRARKKSDQNGEALSEIRKQVNGNVEKAVRAARHQIDPQVLLVDDDVFDLQQMTTTLRLFNAQIFEARDAAQAADLCRDRVGSGRGLPFDLVLVDLKLPGTDASDIVRMIADVAPWVPVVVVTGQMQPMLVERVLKEGATTFIKKPLDEQTTEKLFRQFHIPFIKN